MKIAFVGKGGSGKSTVSTLFFLHLLSLNKNAAVIDADINVHVPELLGLPHDSGKALSLPQNTADIKEYLRGSSTRIASASHMYKTTPPSSGANLFMLKDTDRLIERFFSPFDGGYVATVGTYEKDEIGRSCYHTNLSVFENMLSFASLERDEWLVSDMVAGIDAFSNTLHMQFDILVLVVEPSKEGLTVFDQYIELARHAGVADKLFVVGNKVADEEDAEYIASHVGDRMIGYLPYSQELKKARQRGEPLSKDSLTLFDSSVFTGVMEKARDRYVDPNVRLEQLYALHHKYINQDYVRNEVGDISGQIDPEFSF